MLTGGKGKEEDRGRRWGDGGRRRRGGGITRGGQNGKTLASVNSYGCAVGGYPVKRKSRGGDRFLSFCRV